MLSLIDGTSWCSHGCSHVSCLASTWDISNPCPPRKHVYRKCHCHGYDEGCRDVASGIHAHSCNLIRWITAGEVALPRQLPYWALGHCRLLTSLPMTPAPDQHGVLWRTEFEIGTWRNLVDARRILHSPERAPRCLLTRGFGHNVQRPVTQVSSPCHSIVKDGTYMMTSGRCRRERRRSCTIVVPQLYRLEQTDRSWRS